MLNLQCWLKISKCEIYFKKHITNLARTNKDIILLSGDIGNRMFDDFKEVALVDLLIVG